MFTQIKIQGALNFPTVSQFLQHCSQTKNLRAVEQFHAHVIAAGLLFVSPNLQTNLALTYTSCIGNNSLKILTRLLKSFNPSNPLPFNSIISHFSHHGYDRYALYTFNFMHCNSVYVDSYAFCSSLKSAANCFKDVIFGKMMHAYVEKSGWLCSVFVGSALVDFYAKLKCMSDAGKVFDEIPEKNIVCVNALLSGYAEAKMWGVGIELVRRLPLLRLEADNLTFSAALRACNGLYAVELGKEIHASVVRRVIDVGADVFLQSLLIEMYGKCGLVESAKRVFSMAGYMVGSRRRDVVLWTSMLGVYGRSGDYIEVIRLFKDMVTEGVRPDGVAFLTVISACSHTGQVELGIEYFESMARDYGLVASREHYSCLVDLLCRAGELEKAWKIVSEMPHTAEGAVSMWGSLLSACNECGNIKLGKMAAQKAFELEPDNVGIYVLLSNMYARYDMWDEIEQLRELMNRRGLKKDTGWSSVDAA